MSSSLSRAEGLADLQVSPRRGYCLAVSRDLRESDLGGDPVVISVPEDLRHPLLGESPWGIRLRDRSRTALLDQNRTKRWPALFLQTSMLNAAIPG